MGQAERHDDRGRRLGAALALAALLATASARADDPPAPPALEPGVEVLVEGDRQRGSDRDPSAASYVLREGRLHQPGQSAADALAQVPGVQVSRGGAGSDLATASIRGASSAQTPIYLAGVRLNDDITGTADLSQIPPWMLQRVEVFRGNAPADADRLGIGGAIFFEPLLPRGTKVGAGLGVGSFGELAARASGSFGDERAGAMIALQRQSARNDYRYVDALRPGALGAEEQTRRNADFVAYDLWSLGRLRLGGGSLTAITNAFVRDQGVTGLTLNPATAARSHVQRWLGAVTAALPCARAEPDRCRIELSSAAILADRNIEDPLGELGLSSRRVSSRGARVSEQARLRYRLSDRLALTGSAAQEFETLDLALDGGERQRARRDVTRGAASASFTLLPALELNALAAIEHHGTRGFTPTDTVQPSGRIGARLRLGDALSLSANVGRYARVPTLGELHGISPIVLGNPLLAPERSSSFDLGAKLSTTIAGNSLFAELFGFARLASDLIAYRQSSLGVVKPYNTASARILGLELAAGAQLFHHLRAELALTLLDPRDTSGELGQGNLLLPYQARLVAAPSLELFHGPLPALALDRVSLAARLHHRAELRVDPAGLIPRIPAQSTLDLELGLLFLKRRLGAQLRLANLSDGRNADVLGLPLPGRSVHGAMEVTW